MKVKPIGSNQTEVIMNNGNHVLFSYETPVAVSTIDGIFVTEEKYSNTTTRHINKWCAGINQDWSAYKVSQNELENLIGE